MIDDLHVSFILGALNTHEDANIIASPQVLCMEGKNAEISIMTEEYYYLEGYYEPNNSNVTRQEPNRVEIGTHLWLKPILTPDNKNVNLNLKLENTQLKGFVEGKYKGKRPTDKPTVDVISTTMPCLIPDGKTMLIGGLKINEHVTKGLGKPQLKDLPLIGAAFNKNDKNKKQNMLLILIKPIINPEQKATKILPGQEDSEEHIRRLAKQLDKKIKQSSN
jgi:general secretion pathway protein D